MTMKYPSFEKLRKSYVRKEVIFLADVALSVMASVIVIFGLELLIPDIYAADADWIYMYLAGACLGSAVMFLLAKTYKIIIRHLSVRDFLPFASAVAGKAFLAFCPVVFTKGYSNTLLLTALADALFTFIVLIGVRIVLIIAYETVNQRLQEKYKYKRVLVYGTSDKSVATIIRLRNSSHYKVLGFIERSKSGGKMILDNLPVFRFGEGGGTLENTVLRSGVDAILFARQLEARCEEDGLIKFCSHNHIEILIVPDIDEVTDGKAILHPRAVKMEDLLERKEISISLEAIRSELSGKVVMVTGAAGSIGSELCRQLAELGVGRLVLFDNAETPMHNISLELKEKFPGMDFIFVIGDVRQTSRLDFVFRRYRPEVVFHAAAYKHVPMMEANPCEAVAVNLGGSRNVADFCIRYDVEKMVMISTDKAVNPTNIMGCSKRLAEIYVQALGLAIESGERQGRTKFVTTRFGNVLGSNGSVIPLFREQISRGGPVTVTHPDITRFFMTIPEACRLVMEAATMTSGNQIFVFDMGEPVKIDKLARRMITLAGFEPDKDIKIEYSGLRPGEKLYEEVLASEENTLPTFHERIRIAKVRQYGFDEVLQTVEQLTAFAVAVDIPQMVRLMKRTVPEYHTENEVYKDL